MNECPACGAEMADEDGACSSCGQRTAPATCERHPERPTRGECVLCGTALCEACDHGDRRYPRCEAHADVPIIENWAEVLAVPDEVEARLIEENLRAEGLDPRILSQKDHSAFPVEFGDLARVRILVPTFAYLEAERVLAAHRDALGEVTFGCPHCGEPYGDDEAACSRCGEALV